MTNKDKKINKKENQELIEENTKKARKDMFLEYVPYLIIIFFIVFIRSFIATPVNVNGSSMYPTLHDGDTMLLYKLTKTIRGVKRFDIVVVTTDSGRLIKRVIGLPGDKIRYEITENDKGEETGVLYINDKIVEEDFLKDSNKALTCEQSGALCNDGLEVPDGEYFVMGDNRVSSKDSRMLGTIPESDIMGTAELILFPFDRIGIAK